MVSKGGAAGQEVFHAHIHIIPRYHGDRGGSMKSVARMGSDKALDAIAAKIRSTFESS